MDFTRRTRFHEDFYANNVWELENEIRESDFIFKILFLKRFYLHQTFHLFTDFFFQLPSRYYVPAKTKTKVLIIECDIASVTLRLGNILVETFYVTSPR